MKTIKTEILKSIIDFTERLWNWKIDKDELKEMNTKLLKELNTWESTNFFVNYKKARRELKEEFLNKKDKDYGDMIYNSTVCSILEAFCYLQITDKKEFNTKNNLLKSCI